MYTQVLKSTCAKNLNFIIYAFADIDINGNIYLPKSTTGSLNDLKAFKKQNPAVKILISVGGWNYRDHFKTYIDSPNAISRFANSSKILINEHGFDGLDID